VERHATLANPLAATHLGATEAARTLDPDAERAALHRRGNSLAHRAAERHAAHELLAHAHLARIDGRVQLLRLTRCPQDPAVIRTHTAMHADLLDAIADGQAERAAAIARAHALGQRL
jgi:hypothetical protein